MDATEAPDLDRFMTSAQRVVDYLNDRTPLTDWSVSRISDGEQVHLHVRGNALLHVGDRVPWDETFCRRMLGGASTLVEDALLDPAYADLPTAKEIRAYAGVPIVEGDGSVFGTLCGARAEPLRPEEWVDEDLLGVFSELLSTQLALVRSSAVHHRASLLAEALANSDRLTGLMNRRGWDLVVAAAQERVTALGDRGAVLMIDLDDLKLVNDTAGHRAGDRLLTTAASALRGASRPGEGIARYGGDEFAVYLDGVGIDLADVTRRYAGALAAAGVAASVGSAPVAAGPLPGTEIEEAMAEADVSMYAEKVRRRAQAAPAGRPR
ncbi:diguanylate cyclase [Nocardioides sp. AN3]